MMHNKHVQSFSQFVNLSYPGGLCKRGWSHPCMFKSNSVLCLLCVGALAHLGGPTAGREGSMGACGPTEKRIVVTGRTVGTLTAATNTQTTDIPGESVRHQAVGLHFYVEVKGLLK